MEQAGNELAGAKNLGDSVVTTLDMELQQAAYAALGDRRGAVIAMEPDTGKILAMVSKPGYDPNTLLQDWTALTDSSNNQGQLVNRVTAGLYPPGSTFKIVTALEYVRENPDDYKDFHFDCNDVRSRAASWLVWRPLAVVVGGVPYFGYYLAGLCVYGA